MTHPDDYLQRTDAQREAAKRLDRLLFGSDTGNPDANLDRLRRVVEWGAIWTALLAMAALIRAIGG